MNPSEDALHLVSPQQLEEFLSASAPEVAGILNPIDDIAEWILQEVTGLLGWLFNQLTEWLSEAGGAFWNFIRGLLSELWGWIQDGFNIVVGQVESWAEWIGEFLAEVRDHLQSVLYEVRDWIGGFLAEVRDHLQSILYDVWDSLGGLIGDALGVIGDFIDNSREWIGNRIEDARAGTEFLIGNLTDWLAENVKQPILGALGGIANFTAFLGIPDFREEGMSFVDYLVDFWERALDKTKEILADILSFGLDIFLQALEKSYAKVGAPFFAALLANAELPEEVRVLVQQAADPTEQVGAFLGRSITDTAVSSASTSFVGALLSPLTRSLNTTFLPSRLSFDALNAALTRQIMPPDDVIREAHEQGLSGLRMATMRELNRPRLGEAMLLDQALRFPDTIPQSHQELLYKGWTPEDIVSLTQLRLFVPGVGDLVRFAVREAFNPEIVDRFNLDADLPGDFVTEAARQGVTEDVARLFWRAHWDLPSISQGFEMVHRTVNTSTDPEADSFTLVDGSVVQNVIGMDTLGSLLRTQDVMQFWRDKVEAISYVPFTRVDVRRMHKLGILDDAAVERAYLDLGYRQSEARQLMDFVIDLNSEAAQGAFRGIAIRRFKEGWTDVNQFDSELQALGYGPAEITKLTMGAQLEYELDYYNDLERIEVEAFRKDQITVEEFDILLTDLGMVPDRRASLIRLEVLRKTPKLKPPTVEEPQLLTLAQLQRAYKSGDLTESEVFDELTDRGYKPRDVGIILNQFRAEPPPPTRDLTLAQLQRALRTAQLTEDQVRAELAERGFDARDIGILVEQFTLAPPPPAPPSLTLAQLQRALRLKDLTEAQIEIELEARGFSPENVIILLAQFRPPPPPEPAIPEPRTLTVGQLMTALRRDIIAEDDLRAQLEERVYGVEDIDVLVAIAKRPPPAPPRERIRQLPLGQLKALFIAGIITVDEFLDGLNALGFTDGDALRLLELELQKQAPPEGG